MGRYYTLRKEEDTKYSYPEDMKLILAYLKKNGELHCTGKEIEELWMDFSDERYCAGWMGVSIQPDSEVTNLLREFAEWIDNK